MASQYVWICDRTGKVVISPQDRIPAGWDHVQSKLLCDECMKELSVWLTNVKDSESVINLAISASGDVLASANPQ